ncbi:MAG: LacI family DNA-binding transcriptional regulator [Microbacteriaceae bacterium]
MSKRPTILDVAERAGVSKSLVGMVFASSEGVSDVRRERVLRAAAELGYTPNAWARSLRSNSAGFVGIIVADFHNPLFTEIADTARQFFAQQGVFSFVSVASIVDGPTGPVVDPAPIQHLLDLKPSSIVIVGGLPNHGPLSSLPEDFPVVVALSAAVDLPAAAVVRSDDSVAMRLVCEHLRGLGHSRVAYVGPSGRLVADRRRQAFESEAESCGLGFVTVSTGGRLDEPGGFEAASGVLASDPTVTAMVCFNDNVAFGVQDAVERATRAGHAPVAVTGFDNTYIAQLERISLTSVEQETSEIVRVVCGLLADGERWQKHRGTETLVKPGLVVRSSTAGVAVTR